MLAWAGWALNSTALDDDTARGIGLRPVGPPGRPGRHRGAGRRDGHRPGRARWTSSRWSPRRWPAGWSAPSARRWSAPRCSGALLLVLADLGGRRLFAPTQLPAGVLTAAIGGPYLMFLLLRGRRRSREADRCTEA